VFCCAQGPEVVIDEPSLNFGLVRLGDVVEKHMTLRSLAQVITHWTLKDKPLMLDLESSDTIVSDKNIYIYIYILLLLLRILV
jgi:hypothetical protein